MNNIEEIHLNKNEDQLANLLLHIPENQKKRLLDNNYRFHMGYQWRDYSNTKVTLSEIQTEIYNKVQGQRPVVHICIIIIQLILALTSSQLLLGMNEIFLSKPILWCMSPSPKLKNDPFICDLEEICNPNSEKDLEVFASNGFKYNQLIKFNLLCSDQSINAMNKARGYISIVMLIGVLIQILFFTRINRQILINLNCMIIGASIIILISSESVEIVIGSMIVLSLVSIPQYINTLCMLFEQNLCQSLAIKIITISMISSISICLFQYMILMNVTQIEQYMTFVGSCAILNGLVSIIYNFYSGNQESVMHLVQNCQQKDSNSMIMNQPIHFTYKQQQVHDKVKLVMQSHELTEKDLSTKQIQHSTNLQENEENFVMNQDFQKQISQPNQLYSSFDLLQKSGKFILISGLLISIQLMLNYLIRIELQEYTNMQAQPIQIVFMSDVIGRLLTVMLMFVFENETDEFLDREAEVKTQVHQSSSLVLVCSTLFSVYSIWQMHKHGAFIKDSDQKRNNQIHQHGLQIILRSLINIGSDQSLSQFMQVIPGVRRNFSMGCSMLVGMGAMALVGGMEVGGQNLNRLWNMVLLNIIALIAWMVSKIAMNMHGMVVNDNITKDYNDAIQY